jgi:DNA-binding IclR family transcriptional regulator
MDIKRVSKPLAAVWHVLVTHPQRRWSNADLAQHLGLPQRTVRHSTAWLARAGVLDRWETFPNYLYRLAPNAAERHPYMYEQLERLTSVLVEPS